MPRIRMRPETSSPETSDSDTPDSDTPRPEPSSGPSISIIHLSVAQVLAQGRTYTGKPPLGPLAFPRKLSYTIVDPDPQLPLEVTPGELYAVVGNQLKKIRPLVDCEEARGWMGTAEGFQAGTKMGGRTPRVKVEAAEEPEDDSSQDLGHVESYDARNDTRRLKRRYGLRDTTPAQRDTPPDPSPPPREVRRRKLERRARSTSSDTLVVPDLVPDEVESRKAEATRKNQALKRGLGLKSLLPHDHHGKAEVVAHAHDKEELEVIEEALAHNRNRAEDLAAKQPPGRVGAAMKTIMFTRRLVKLREVLREAMEALTESNLEQLEPYFEVDWMIEDIEAAVQGAISRKNLTDRAKGGKGFKSYPGLSFFTFPRTDDLPHASKNRKITELMMRLTPLVKTLYRAVEVLNEPYLLEIEGLFDVDWMIEDVCRAITGAVSCRRLNEKMLKKMQCSEDEGRVYVH